MRRFIAQLVLLAMLVFSTGAALAAHRAVAHPHHEADHDCAVCYVLTTRAIDAPPATPTLVFDNTPRFTLTPVRDVAPRYAPISPAHPRGPPIG